jgi:hypothetical protein
MNLKLKLALRSTCFLLSLLALNSASAQTAQTAVAAYGRLPMQFEQRGDSTAPLHTVVARGPGYSVTLLPTSASLLLHAAAPSRHAVASKAYAPELVQMHLAGANDAATMVAEQPLKGYINYMNGPDRRQWRLDVPTFAQARVRDAYPGIDVVYYGTQQQLEYDFVVAPHADASRIRLTLGGAKPIAAADGSLRLVSTKGSDSGDLTFQKPIIYQQINGVRRPVSGSFAIASNGDVSFRLGAYDHAQPLVIDPLISYASYFGGAGEDEINGSALNASNQLYAVGQTFSTTLPATSGEFETGPIAGNNGHDAFVTKFSADGRSVLWTTYLSGNGDDFATAVAVNSSDEAYVVGYTNSCGSGGTSYATAGEFPFTASAVQSLCSPDVIGFNNFESNGGSYDAFLVKLSADGRSELYGTPLGGSANDIASSVALDASGKVYIVGETQSTMYFLSSDLSRASDVPSYPVNNHATAAIGRSNYPTTTTAFYTNTTESKNNSLTCDSSDNCPGQPIGSVSGPQDEQAFLTVLSADLGTITYSSLIGGGVLGGCGNGNCNTNGIAIATGLNNQVFIGGNTSSAHWPTTAGALAPTCSNAGTATSQCPMTGWLAGFDVSKSGAASLLFTTYVNGSSAGTNSGNPLYPGSDVYGLATDSKGNVVATGDTNADNFPTTPGSFEPACVPSPDGNGDINVCSGAFVLKLTPTGSTVWSTYYISTKPFFGGESVVGRGVALDAKDNVYVVGTGNSANVPVMHPLVSAPGGGPDVFLLEFSSTGDEFLLGTYLGAGGGISLDNNALHLDSNMSAYLTGWQGYNPYGGTSFPTTAGAFDTALQGTDGFVAKIITQQQPTATALAVSPNPATPAQTVTLKATVTTSSTLTGTTVPTGTVTFYNNASSVLGTAPVGANGLATFTGTLAAGTYSVTASYPGDTVFSSSTSSATALTVSSANATTTALTIAPATSTYGTPETLTATVKAGSSVATSGTVSFTAGNMTLATASLNSSGVATASVTPPVGMYSVTAAYAGTYNATSNPNGFSASISSGVALSVTKANSTTTLTSSSLTVGPGVNFTLTAAVPPAATGTVNFLNGTTSLGTATISSGSATLKTSLTNLGTASLTAVYSGDTNFNGSTSSPLVVSVAAPGFTVTASPSSLTIARGSTGTTTLTITPQGGLTGSLTLACAGLPSQATCTFSPVSVTLATAAVQDALTIGTGTLTASARTPQLLHRGRNSVLEAGMMVIPAALLGFLCFTKRRKLLSLTLCGALLLTTLATLSGCAGSTPAGTNATPAGTYSVSVTLTSGTTSQTVPFSVIVQ